MKFNINDIWGFLIVVGSIITFISVTRSSIKGNSLKIEEQKQGIKQFKENHNKDIEEIKTNHKELSEKVDKKADNKEISEIKSKITTIEAKIDIKADKEDIREMREQVKDIHVYLMNK